LAKRGGHNVNGFLNTIEYTELEPWAGLLTYWHEGVYDYQRIVYSTHPERYVREIAEVLSQSTSTLVEYYAEYVNYAELELIHESFGTGSYPDNGLSWLDVSDLLKRLPDIAVVEYRESGSRATESSVWYTHLIEFLNDTFPYDDGVWLNFEGPLSVFLPALLDFEAKGFKEISFLSDSGAIWLGRLAVLSRLSWGPGVPRERWQALHQLVKGFNNSY
jgi:hypothetical protein